VTAQTRRKLGVVGLWAGGVLFVGGIVIAHFTGLPTHDSVGREIYSWIPRCAFFENDPARCWVLPIAGQSIALLGSQLMMGAIVLGWIYRQEMTWAKATVGAFLFTLEMMILFGIVPNQWLNLAQGTLDWSENKDVFTIPPWLVLNNEVTITFGVLKDAIAGGYSAGVLGTVAIVAYQVQERSKRAGQPPPTTTSQYGRPVVRGSR
jgi:hypothetical protein